MTDGPLTRDELDRFVHELGEHLADPAVQTIAVLADYAERVAVQDAMADAMVTGFITTLCPEAEHDYEILEEREGYRLMKCRKCLVRVERW